MSVDTTARAAGSPAPASPGTAAPANPVRRLREMARAGLPEDPAPVRELLRQATDRQGAIDLEAAGGLLAAPARRERLAASGALTEQRVAVLGSSTLDSLTPLLTAVLVRDGMLPEIRQAGFNQWRLEILSGAPAFAGFAPRLTLCLLDDAAVFDEIGDPLDAEAVERRCAVFPAELAAWAGRARETLGGLIVLCTLPLSPLRRDRLVSYAARARLDAAWQRMNAEISALAEALPATVVLSHEALAQRAAGPVFGAGRMRHLAAHVYSPDYLLAVAEELSRLGRADLGRAAKCLVLDLDNTLWGGVLGDDGVGGLRLGGGYPGSAHRELQQLARDYQAQGVLLAVASKNDEDRAREAIATHPEMVLRPESFVAVHAHWDPKPGSVRRLAADLNLGVDAMVFVDDNKVERGLMRSELPQAATVELPADPADYATHLAARGDFLTLRLTEEDRDRTELYRARAARAELAGSATDLTAYLAALDSELTVEPAGPLNTGRIVQLFGKTNQFNLTGLRYGEQELGRRTADGGGAFFGARLTDTFGDNGLIAALCLAEEPDGAWAVENFVLSCRVFARGVEDALLALVLRAARAAGAPAVTGRFVPSPKNTRFAGFYAGQGFAQVGEAEPETGATAWRRPLTDPQTDPLPGVPGWIRVPDDKGAFHVR